MSSKSIIPRILVFTLLFLSFGLIYAQNDYKISKGTRYLGNWNRYRIPSLEKSFLDGAGSFIDPNSPVAQDTLFVMSYSVIFGILGGFVALAGLVFIPLQLLCQVFSKNVPEYSYMDRFLTRFMLLVTLLFIFPLVIVGLWSTSAFYIAIEDPVSNLGDQVTILKNQYRIYYQNARQLLASDPSIDIMPTAALDEFNVLLQNHTENLYQAVEFGETWTTRGALGGLIPYVFPLFMCVFGTLYLILGRRWMYVVTLSFSIISLFCLMGVSIPNSAWAVLVSSQCTSGVRTNMDKYLNYYNPKPSCVAEIVESYVWNEPFSECTPDSWVATSTKIEAAKSSAPIGVNGVRLAEADKAWKVMSNIGRTHDLYLQVVGKACLSTSNRGATLFFVTIMLWAYTLLFVYLVLFSTDRLKRVRSYAKFRDEDASGEVNQKELDSFQSNIRERVKNDQFELDNNNVLWMAIVWGFIMLILLLFLALGFGLGSQTVTISN